ncbi:hypothetical protein AB1Y20_006631 [Prymnesium parvum]|uniref:SHOCT domain-containing protein n=1 Tax=Prymnesium parvum TaxID=97485 RepID=A0AB34J078_PRYPA
MTACMVKKDYMGRVFLPPAPSAELHINFGWNVQNGQLYPEWVPIFEEAISKKDYDALVSKIRDYLDKNAINELLPTVMPVVPSTMVRDDDSMEKLKKLKELLDAGAISNEEYNQKKAELMKRI